MIYRRRAGNSRFTIKTEKEICKLYKQGLPMSSIASVKSCSEGTVRNILLYYKIKLCRPGNKKGSGTPFWNKMKKVEHDCQ
jgi:hypothetical protein